MAPKRTENPPKGDGIPPNGEEIPTGWSVKLQVEKDGTITTTYYCPDTGQEFYTYLSLIRYVDYAKRKKIGIYRPLFKSIRKQQIDALKKHNPIGHRKTTAALSIPGRPHLPNSDSLAADQNDDSKPSSSGKSTDEDVEEYYVPEQDAGVSTNREIDEADNS